MKLYVRGRYGVVPATVLENPDLSLRAKGLFAFLQSKPDGWRFSIERISRVTKEGREAIRGAIRELEEAGFLIRIPTKDKEGKFKGYDYILVENPQESPAEFKENPSSENPPSDKPPSDSWLTNIKKKKKKKSNKKRDTNSVIGQKAKEWVKIFAQKYKEAFGVDYIVSWGKDVRIMKKVVVALQGDEERFKEAIDRYFKKFGRFYEEVGWTIVGFASALQGLILQAVAKQNKEKVAELLKEVANGGYNRFVG